MKMAYSLVKILKTSTTSLKHILQSITVLDHEVQIKYKCENQYRIRITHIVTRILVL